MAHRAARPRRRFIALHQQGMARLHNCDKCGSLIAQDPATGEATMSSFSWRDTVLASTLLAGLVWVAPAVTAAAQKAVPDFSSGQFGWVGMGGGFGAGGEVFSPVAGQLPPLANDPAHPFVPNGTKAQPTYRIADISNPNLKPWVKEHMKKDNDEVLAGKIAFTARSGIYGLWRTDPALLPADPQGGLDHLLGRPAGAPRLFGRAPFGETDIDWLIF
jgi:hypothetical protein